MAAPQHSARDLSTPELDDIQGIQDVLAWLGSPDHGDPEQDLLLLRSHLSNITRADLPVVQFHRLLDLFFERAQVMSLALQPQLAAASLPLEPSLRGLAEGLQEVHGMMAQGYNRIMADMDERPVRNKRRNPPLIAARALRCLSDQLHTAYYIAAPPPGDLWRQAHILYRSAYETADSETNLPGTAVDAEYVYKGMLARAAAQPEGFSPSETAIIDAYLERNAPLVEIFYDKPEDPSDAWFWVDIERDMGPVPSSRRIPATHGKLLFFSCVQLARRLDEQLSALEKGAQPTDVKLPDIVATPGAIAFLRRTERHWNLPPHRHYSRRQNSYIAHVCIGLKGLWQLMHERNAAAQAVPTTEWMVLNESAAGFAVMHVAGEMEGLRTGSVVALRNKPEDSWNICIVRWMRSENPQHIELGLELVAPTAESVNIVFRNGRTDQKPTPGLLLPPVRALRQHQAIIAPLGSYSSRRFFIVSGEEKTHVAQGRLLSLDMQTDSVELFQFEADPYPI